MKKIKNNPGLIQNLLVLNEKKECKDGEGGKRASRRELILGYVSRPILGYLLSIESPRWDSSAADVFCYYSMTLFLSEML